MKRSVGLLVLIIIFLGLIVSMKSGLKPVGEKEVLKIKTKPSTIIEDDHSLPTPTSLPESGSREKIDFGQSTSDGRHDLQEKMEDELLHGQLETAVTYMATLSLVDVNAKLREQGLEGSTDRQRIQLREMERYGRIYPAFLNSYDYALTLLTSAMTAENLPELESRVANIRSQFPLQIAGDDECIRYLVALRRQDTGAEALKTSCESSTGEFSSYAKALSGMIVKKRVDNVWNPQ
jgi:hypothetical protein